jgi:hypothetical protein
MINVTEAGDLAISGDNSKRSVLSKNLRGFAEAGSEDEHLHVEYFPNHFYLAPESAPLIFAFK